ncbi:MAG: polyprenyl diphosphate synthase [archaeon]|nr:polyprenyl diphosphate synthase [archaeon]
MKAISEVLIEVYGRVQGINFRNNMKIFADELGVKGYVRNREDGSVVVVAQGDKKKLQSLVSWIESNPGFSKIDGLSFRWKEHSINYNEFSIVHEGNYVMDKAKSLVNLGKNMVFGSQKSSVPVHIAIIPDGNRRWAKEKGMIGSMGHYKSGNKDNIKELFDEARKWGVKYLSLWGFSTENWTRDEKETKAIFDLILKSVDEFKENAEKNKIRFRHFGRKDRLPKNLRKALKDLEEETKEYDNFNVQLFLDYGGRDEVLRAINRLIKNGIKKVDEKTFSMHLDTAGIPDPDFIIRTSGEKRISGLMPWQSVYAEYYFTSVHFPDFDAKELRKAIEDFGRRDRRFGGDTTK